MFMDEEVMAFSTDVTLTSSVTTNTHNTDIFNSGLVMYERLKLLVT